MSQSNGIDPAFGHWLTGFIDGEGHFGMAPSHGGIDARPRFSIEVRDDDFEIIEEIHRRTGIGKVVRRTRKTTTLNGRPQIAWVIGRNADMRQLVQILEEYPLRAKKQRDFEIWKQAVALLQHRPGRPVGLPRNASLGFGQRLLDLKRELEAVRAYKEPPPAPASDKERQVKLF